MRKYTKKAKSTRDKSNDHKWIFNDKLLVFNYRVDDVIFEADVEEMSLNDWLKKFAKEENIPKDDLLFLEKLWVEKIGTRDKMSIMTYLKLNKKAI